LSPERLAEPHNVRTEQAAADVAPGRETGERDAAVLSKITALRAAETPDAAVELNDLLASSGLVEPVHILCNDCEVPEHFLNFHQGPVSGIGLASCDKLPTPGVPLPDQGWIPSESFRRGQLLGVVVAP